MVTKKEILEVFVFLRKYNLFVSDETLDFIKDASYEKLEEIKQKEKEKVSNEF